MYPLNDTQFEDTHVAKVTKSEDGWEIGRSDGWSFYIPSDSPIEPKEGMQARFYGKGIGFDVRGLYLCGVKVFYRTAEEQEEEREIYLYGNDAQEWIRRWDSGEPVWSIEMGGLGPGYEQCIHIAAAEVLRHLLAEKYDAQRWADTKKWKEDRDKIEAALFKNETVNKLGLSGAQWGAAMIVATFLYERGPRAIMRDDRVKDRHIQVSKNFPG